MGNVERVDLTLPLNEMVYYVRRDAALRNEWQRDLPGLARQFGLSDAELAALQPPDVKALMAIGVHQYLIPHILRLTYGASNMTNDHPALVAYQKAFPAEARAAIGDSKWDRTDG
jgi:Aromatic-ring-opening dioxygenase LigAB, LigA subunit